MPHLIHLPDWARDSTSPRPPYVALRYPSQLPASTLFPLETQELTSRFSLLTLLHAKFFFHGLDTSSLYPYTTHPLKSLNITAPGDLHNLRKQIRLPSSRTEAEDTKGRCTFLDWLEHIAWFLGKSPLANNPLDLDPGRYSCHTTFFGSYGNSNIPCPTHKIY